LDRVLLAMIVHAHQPVGNFDHVVEEAYQKSYLPFVRALLQHPNIRLSLHFSGSLLEWIEARHAEYFDELGRLVNRQQVEMVGGGYYEPILTAIPDRDKIAQIRKLAEFLRRHFGPAPSGAWITERVWEPALARPLAEAGVGYAALDDTHFLAAGLEASELHGDYVTEEAGYMLRLIPSLKSLRYTIPFREPEETLEILRQGLNLPSRLFAFGDDCEKFGVWPGTYDHCYKNGWLERFFNTLENAGEWLETTTTGAYVAAHEPLGRIYLPAASYPEMMEWALPPRAARDLKACVEESGRMPGGERFRRFLRGGIWRNFLTRYSEANQIHKLMLEVSGRIEEARKSTPDDPRARTLVAEAEERLQASQCNDAYWHGVFGGLYAPHLRSALLRNLIQAESLLDKLSEPKTGGARGRLTRKDFDADGREEILAEHSQFAMVVHPADGGTASSLRYKPCDVELINSLMRRPEAYHDLLRQAATSGQAAHEGPASIHDIIKSKGPHLEALLQYDRYERRGFRTYVFPIHRQWQNFQSLELGELGELAGGAWEATTRAKEPATIELRRRAGLEINGLHWPIEARKSLSSQALESGWRMECRSSVATESACPVPLALGVELIFNLLAPDAPDRYFAAQGVRRPLAFKGEIESDQLEIVDEWQKVRITLGGQPRCRWWVTPIETVSQSESGFESIYQGSAILAVWKIDSAPWQDFTSTLRVDIARI
jgi:hypothetical protein